MKRGTKTRTFEDCLEEPGAKDAFDILVRKKVDPELLKHWLHDIAVAPDHYVKKNQRRREAEQLVSRAKKFASEVERAAQSPPIFTVASGLQLTAMLELPHLLRAYAAMWEESLSIFRPGHMSPRSQRIAALLDIVKDYTKRYHYAEVADLLNAADSASGRARTDPHWDATSLKQLQYRWRKRLARS